MLRLSVSDRVVLKCRWHTSVVRLGRKGFSTHLMECLVAIVSSKKYSPEQLVMVRLTRHHGGTEPGHRGWPALSARRGYSCPGRGGFDVSRAPLVPQI